MLTTLTAIDDMAHFGYFGRSITAAVATLEDATSDLGARYHALKTLRNAAAGSGLADDAMGPVERDRLCRSLAAAVERAARQLADSDEPLRPGDERVQRMREVARASGAGLYSTEDARLDAIPVDRE